MNKRAVAAFVLAAITAAADSPGWAQENAFVAAVREFGWGATSDIPSRSPGAIVDRMTAALAEWDREIAEREQNVQRDLRQALRERAFPLHVELGLAYGRRGRFADALREFDAAAALRPDASDVHVLRGLTFEASARPDEAGRAFRTAWERDRQHPVKAYYALRHSSGREREGPRATLNNAYQQLITTTPRVEPRDALFVPMGAINEQLWSAPIVGDADLADGFARLAAGDYSGAIAALRRPAVTAESPLASLASAGRLEAEGRISEARRAYEIALTGTLSGHSRIYIAIGRLAQVEGDLAGAIAAFQRAVRLNPNDGVMHRELALALAADGQHDDAFVELVAALLINSGDASALASIGQLFLNTARYGDAAAALRRALRVAPNRFETHYALATALTQLGDTKEAAAELDRFERGRQQQVEQRRRELNEAVQAEEANHSDTRLKPR